MFNASDVSQEQDPLGKGACGDILVPPSWLQRSLDLKCDLQIEGLWGNLQVGST